MNNVPHYCRRDGLNAMDRCLLAIYELDELGAARQFSDGPQINFHPQINFQAIGRRVWDDGKTKVSRKGWPQAFAYLGARWTSKYRREFDAMIVMDVRSSGWYQHEGHYHRLSYVGRKRAEKLVAGL